MFWGWTPDLRSICLGVIIGAVGWVAVFVTAERFTKWMAETFYSE